MRKQTILSVFLVGLVCVSLLWDSLVKEISISVGRFILPVAVIILAVFWRRLEMKSHQQHIHNWSILREQGMFRFILGRYLFLRGGILFVVLFLAFYAAIRLSSLVSVILLSTFAVIVLTLFFVGREEWKVCEEEFQVSTLREAAEQSRRRSALTN
jgi:hypothetical protein